MRLKTEIGRKIKDSLFKGGKMCFSEIKVFCFAESLSKLLDHHAAGNSFQILLQVRHG